MASIALIGTGLVGRAWAISFARAGHDVRLFDETPELARMAVAFAAEMLPMLASERLLDGQSPDAVARRLRIVGSLEEALAGAVHVQESTPEQLDAKVATLDAKSSVVQAVAVRDGRILAVGDNVAINKLAGGNTKKVDAGGIKASLPF